MTANVAPELVELTVDGRPVSVPKGTNLIDAAKVAGIDVPYYCYHPHLSIAGNCRMCQLQVKGQPKLTIGCNTTVQAGMEVLTQATSKEVADAQAATLEFILVNHPLDCTVCDQAGHCKLQDYHYDYNARSSRFLEEKEHKVKAAPLGPNVMLDGERCIMCTRCIRFCDEVTGTSELGMLNRGDQSVISINPGKELDNPLSGTVVDLCPVGALTHRPWRFNTRIWFTKQTESVCPGCSTGCSTKVAVRDHEVVQVKGRLNPFVNKEWMCDEGRYGYHRFLPENRVVQATTAGKNVSLDEALQAFGKLQSSADTLVLAGCDLFLEDYIAIKKFFDQHLKQYTAVISYRERPLTRTEAILISPDYAANFRGAQISGFVADDLEQNYNTALNKLRAGAYKQVCIIGDRGILTSEVDEVLGRAIQNASLSIAILTDASHPVATLAQTVLPGRSILEKAGSLVNRNYRLQYSDRVMDFPSTTEPEWKLFGKAGALIKKPVSQALADRDRTFEILRSESYLEGLTIASMKGVGTDLSERLGIQKAA